MHHASVACAAEKLADFDAAVTTAEQISLSRHTARSLDTLGREWLNET